MLLLLRNLYKPLWPWLVTIGIALLLFFSVTLLPHLGTFSALRRAGIDASISWSFLGVITSNNTVLSLVSIALLGLVMGMYVVALIAYVQRFKLTRASLKGVGGSVLGIFGIGCAACGSLILTPLLTVIGATSLLATLPLGGEEFLYIGTVVLGFSIRSLLKKMNEGAVCITNPAEEIIT